MKILFLTASRGFEGKNFEHIMRVHFFSRETDLTMLTTKEADFGRHLGPGAVVVRAPLPGKAALFLFGLWWILKNRHQLADSIIVTEPSTLALLGLFGGMFAGAKWVVDVWDIPIRNTSRNVCARLRTRVVRFIMKQAFRKADCFVVGIRPDGELEYFQLRRERMLCWQTTIWIPDPANRCTAKEHDNAFQIVCMKSNHDPACGLDVLAAAFGRVRDLIPNVTLWVIGTIRSDVRAAVDVLKKYPEVKFCGWLSHEDVMQIIGDAAVCVIPWHDVIDLAQLYPTKVMEYMTEGKAVVASRLAGISEMIDDGHNGLLFTPGDAEDLAAKILTLHRDRDLLETIGKHAAEYRLAFDVRAKTAAILRRLSDLSPQASAAGSTGHAA